MPHTHSLIRDCFLLQLRKRCILMANVISCLVKVCACVHACAYVGAYLCLWRGKVFSLSKPVKFLVLVPFLEADFDEISPVSAQKASNHAAQRQPQLTMHLPLPGERKRGTKWIIQMIISSVIIPVFRVTYRTEHQSMSHWQSINRNNAESACPGALERDLSETFPSRIGMQ